jgi:hypothetical protein
VGTNCNSKHERALTLTSWHHTFRIHHQGATLLCAGGLVHRPGKYQVHTDKYLHRTLTVTQTRLSPDLEELVVEDELHCNPDALEALRSRIKASSHRCV